VLPPVETPLLRLSNLFGGEVYAKCEFLAPSGSFKIHGAAHLLEYLSRENGPRQLMVPSMGNTALGAAAGGRAFGFAVTGVVPRSISRDKDEKLRALDVELIKVEGGGRDVLRTAMRIAQERGSYFVHPHLDSQWTDGYHAIAQQILRAQPGCRAIVFPVGGGGLLMGLTSYFQKHAPHVKLIGVEAHNFPTYARYNHERSATMADGLILEDPHPAVQERIAETELEIYMVKESVIRSALRDLYWRHGLVVEPSSAITVGFLQTFQEKLPEPICVVLTGGNISREDFDALITTTATPS
jgi:threonine dehydratase